VNSVEIRVRGSHLLTLPPEQATVHATVSFDGPQAGPVFAAVTGAVAAVSASIEARHHPKKGPVTRYAIDQVRMGAQRPWNNEGQQLPLVHTAAVSVEATFTDFEDLARWVAWAAGVDGLSIGYVAWDLSEAKRRKVERTARQKAVRDAARRAQDYADALGLGSVQPLGINDPGLGGPVQRKVMLASAVAAPGDGPSEFTLRPEDVDISADVEATFTVRTPR
jgi:uncharacterized protein YggE